jgi:hypothetical protein
MMDALLDGAFQDFQQAFPWQQPARIRWQDAAVSSLPAAETRICTSVADSHADSLGAVCFVTFAPHLGSSNTHPAMPLARLLWSNSDPLKKDAVAVHSHRHCLCEKHRHAVHFLAGKAIAA